MRSIILIWEVQNCTYEGDLCGNEVHVKCQLQISWAGVSSNEFLSNGSCRYMALHRNGLAEFVSFPDPGLSRL